MEEIMQAITKAEEEAARMKERALISAREIAAKAEEEAANVKNAAAAKAKSLRENGIRAAQEQANGDYLSAIEKSRKSAVSYADENLKKTDHEVIAIVRRICGGC